MKTLKLILVSLITILLVACSSKQNDGAKFIGHWVEKDKHSSDTAAIDISDVGNGSYEITLFKRYSKDDAPEKAGSFMTTLRDGKLMASMRTIIIKNDGSLFYDKEYVR